MRIIHCTFAGYNIFKVIIPGFFIGNLYLLSSACNPHLLSTRETKLSFSSCRKFSTNISHFLSLFSLPPPFVSVILPSFLARPNLAVFENVSPPLNDIFSSPLLCTCLSALCRGGLIMSKIQVHEVLRVRSFNFDCIFSHAELLYSWKSNRFENLGKTFWNEKMSWKIHWITLTSDIHTRHKQR